MKTLNLLALVFFAVLSLSACGKRDAVQIDDAFMPYLQEVQDEAMARGFGASFAYQSSVQFDEGMADTLGGFCRWDEKGEKITINPRHWKRWSRNERIFLLVHELGHCALKRGHDETRMRFKEKIWIYKSVMTHDSESIGQAVDSEELSLEEADELYKYYFDEFFNVTRVL